MTGSGQSASPDPWPNLLRAIDQRPALRDLLGLAATLPATQLHSLIDHLRATTPQASYPIPALTESSEVTIS